MTNCPFILNADGLWQCPECGWVYPRESEKPPHHKCPAKMTDEDRQRMAEAVGDWVQGMLPPGIELTPEQQAEQEKQLKQWAWSSEHGPGTHLHKIIKKRLGQNVVSGCGCGSLMARMNNWGVAGCREHIEEITGHLVDIATKKEWQLQPEEGVDTADIDVGAEVPQTRRTRWLRLLARTTAKLPAGETLIRYQCRRMVELAIRRAEREAKEQLKNEGKTNGNPNEILL